MRVRVARRACVWIIARSGGAWEAESKLRISMKGARASIKSRGTGGNLPLSISNFRAIRGTTRFVSSVAYNFILTVAGRYFRTKLARIAIAIRIAPGATVKLEERVL